MLAGDDEGGADRGGAVEELRHIHGLEIPAWAEGQVYLATHEGLLRVDAEGQWRRVSERPHDFMGFAAHPSEQGTLIPAGIPPPAATSPIPSGSWPAPTAARPGS